jgi:hypothetical protein
MADDMRFPRSGIWNLHSKTDRRWNVQGQFAAFEPDSSPMPMPVEARQTLEELSAHGPTLVNLPP